jgi:protein phosphatase
MGESKKLKSEREGEPANERVCALTDRGRIRERNEDFVYATNDGSLMVCADGLGGLPAGDVASRTGVMGIVERLGEVAAGVDPIPMDAWRKRIVRAIRGAGEDLIEAAGSNPELKGMATTLVVAVVADGQLCVSHVGDVRAYLLRDTDAELLTADHSVVWEAVERGELTREQARTHPSGHLVTQALGLRDELELSSAVRKLESGDRVLLCSDGLWETMPEDELTALLRDGADPVASAAALLEQALQSGGHDNIAVVVYRHP